jgi:DNA-binding response OmpR family regulator
MQSPPGERGAQALVLVVNQSVDTLSLIRSVLEESGFRVLLANRLELDGEELLGFIETHHPDVVVYDVPWPYEERLDAFLALRNDQRQPRCGWLAITTSHHVQGQLLEAGTPVLLKPFEFEELMEAVGSLVTGAEPRRD